MLNLDIDNISERRETKKTWKVSFRFVFKKGFIALILHLRTKRSRLEVLSNQYPLEYQQSAESSCLQINKHIVDQKVQHLIDPVWFFTRKNVSLPKTKKLDLRSPFL